MTVKADAKKRVVRPTSQKITLTKLVPAEPKLVKPRKVNGRRMGAAVARPDRQAIVDAIRADRESR